MQELKRITDSANDGKRLLQRQCRYVVEYKAQRGTVEKFHDEIAEFTVVVAVRIRNDIRVRACAQHRVAEFQLAEKSLVQGNPVRQQLYGHAAADAELTITFVLRFVDVAKPAAPDLRTQAIAAGDEAPV